MRLKGKYRLVIKQVAKAPTCRKNLPLTVAKKYSLSLSARFLSERDFQQDVVVHPKEKTIIDCYDYSDFQYILPSGLENSVVIREATICNTKYKKIWCL